MQMEQLQKDMIAAMKAKDKTRKDAISALVSAVKKVAIDEGCRDDIKEELVNRVVLKEIKSVKEQIDTCPAERTDLLEAYQAEQVERKKLEQTMQELSFGQEDLIRILKKYRLHDPMIWLHQTGAILDPKEMVEVRHTMILRRQQLRKQMEFNTDNAEKAQEQIKKLVTEYPKYAAQILKMVSAYEEKAES